MAAWRTRWTSTTRTMWRCSIPGVAVIPAALAVAESRGRGGQALIDAIVVGYDVQVRVALAARKAPGHTGWHYTSACGIFGAAAAAGRLLGLEGRFGFFPVYLRDYDPTPVLESLGQRFEVERTSLKPFPTCRFTHAPIAALQQILHERALQASHIEEIEARITGAAYSEVCEPLAQKVRPFSRVHAQFSLPYALACVADHGTVGLADLTDEGIHREGVLGLAERVRCIRDPDLEARWGEKIGEAEVRVRTRDGAVVAARALPPGGPEHPMTDADRAAKTKQCLDWGAPDLEPERLARTVDAMRYTSDGSALSRSFTPAEERRRCGSS